MVSIGKLFFYSRLLIKTEYISPKREIEGRTKILGQNLFPTLSNQGKSEEVMKPYWENNREEKSAQKSVNEKQQMEE